MSKIRAEIENSVLIFIYMHYMTSGIRKNLQTL